MNMKGKKMAASLLVCGSLLASIVLMAGYTVREGGLSPAQAASNMNGSTADGYYTGPTHRAMLSVPSIIPSIKTPPVSTNWHTGVPVLEKKVTLHLMDADLSSTVTQLAKMTGLNFAGADMGGQARFTLHMTGVPIWQVMQAMADSCGGSWQCDHGLFALRLRSTT